MASLARSAASIRIVGETVIPEEITSLLGVEPTRAQRKGQQLPSKGPSGVRTANIGIWGLNSADTAPNDLNAQVAELLGKCTQDLTVWAGISRRYRVELFCGWFMGSFNEGAELSPQTLSALGERGIYLGIDLYGPDA